MDSLELSTETRDGYVVVTVRGNLDITTRHKLDAYLDTAGDGASQLIIDLSELTFLDTSGLTVLARHWRHLHRTGGSLILAGARYETARALWITGLAKRLPLADDVDDAIATAGGGSPAGT